MLIHFYLATHAMPIKNIFFGIEFCNYLKIFPSKVKFMPIRLSIKAILIVLSGFSYNVCFAQSVGMDLQNEVLRQDAENSIIEYHWNALLSYTSSINSLDNELLEISEVSREKGTSDDEFFSNLDDFISQIEYSCEKKLNSCSGYPDNKILYAFNIDKNAEINKKIMSSFILLT